MSAPTLLKVDYDTPRVPARLEDRLGLVVACFGARVLWYALARSSGGRGWHLTVAVTRRWAPLRIVAAQAMLGSDWRREAYNARRVAGLRHAGPAARARWNVLYRRKLTVHINGGD